MHAGGCDCKISVYSFCTGNRNPVLYMGKQALQRMDGRNDCGNYHDRDEYIGTSDSEYGEKGIDPWHQRRCDRVCTGSIVPLWNRNGQSDFPGETLEPGGTGRRGNDGWNGPSGADSCICRGS